MLWRVKQLTVQNEKLALIVQQLADGHRVNVGDPTAIIAEFDIGLPVESEADLAF